MGEKWGGRRGEESLKILFFFLLSCVFFFQLRNPRCKYICAACDPPWLNFFFLIKSNVTVSLILERRTTQRDYGHCQSMSFALFRLGWSPRPWVASATSSCSHLPPPPRLQVLPPGKRKKKKIMVSHARQGAQKPGIGISMYGPYWLCCNAFLAFFLWPLFLFVSYGFPFLGFGTKDI